MGIMNLTKDSFVAKVANYESYPGEWIFKGNRPCLIDFHAPWCVYCKALEPILTQLATEYEGKIDIYKVDVDKEPELETAFSIRTIPTLLFAPLGKKPTLMLGTLTKPQIKKWIDKLLIEA